ncbi:MAG: M48 family metalloprotease [Anaerolineales bacterium]|nr:M48 family metalloprotease [Anaerolineales bacterium]
MDGSQPIGHERCPECGQQLPVLAEYTTWCDQCNWNLQPNAPAAPAGLFATLYLQLGQRFSQALYAEVAAQFDLRPRLTTGKVAAFALASLIHLASLLLVAAGALILWLEWPHLFAVILAGLFFLLAWGGRPRIPSVPPDVLPREKFPQLYQLIDSISTTIGGRPIDGVALVPSYNAAYTQAGWRRRRYILLGYPLFYVLAPQEKVAILAHELAHGVNGDPLRGLFVGSAVNSLAYWATALRPTRIWQVTPGMPLAIFSAIFMVPVNWAMRALAGLLRLIAQGLLTLVFRDSQRAEYLADSLAAQVAGSAAMLSGLEKLYLLESVRTAVQQHVLGNAKSDMFAAIKSRIASVPTRELERLRRVNLAEFARLDITHPPTPHRVSLLRQNPILQPQMVLSAAADANLMAELAQQAPTIQRRMADQFMSSIYQGIY